MLESGALSVVCRCPTTGGPMAAPLAEALAGYYWWRYASPLALQVRATSDM